VFYRKSPLFWPLAPHAEGFAGLSDWPTVEAYDDALAARAGVGFRAQPPRPSRGRRRRAPMDPAALYDARIHLEGWVPTRPQSWHDFLNALVWAAFPRAKRALHARQHRAMAARLEGGVAALPNRRSREQDGLALLDEGGIVLLAAAGAAQAATEALEARAVEDVRALLLADRAAAVLFGHALYESILEGPEPVIWGMTTVLALPGPLPAAPAERVALADERLALALAVPESFAHPETFRSLPVDAAMLLPGGPRSGSAARV
jgi:hypothetical protein